MLFSRRRILGLRLGMLSNRNAGILPAKSAERARPTANDQAGAIDRWCG